MIHAGVTIFLHNIVTPPLVLYSLIYSHQTICAISTNQKKLVTAACALVAGLALADGIESANIVGYNDTSITADKWYMVAVQFKDVGDKTDVIAFDDLIEVSGIKPSLWEDEDDQAAQIQYWNGKGYDYYYYISDAYAEGTENLLGKDCWAVDGVEAKSLKQPLGEGFWLKVPSVAIDGTAVFRTLGEVKNSSSVTVDFTANNWKIISNPLPVDVDLNDVVTTGIVASLWENQDTDAAELQYWNGKGYDYYYYISDAYKAGTESLLGKDCWAIDGVQPEGVQIPVGGAAWLRAKQDGSMTFSL